jgi:hypothetical protein
MSRWALNLAIIIAAFAVPAALADILDETDIVVSHRPPVTLNAVLANDVALTNTSTYFDGPSITLGPNGVWLIIASTTTIDSNASSTIAFKLWDGTTVFDSGQTSISVGFESTTSLNAIVTAWSGNIRVSVKDTSNTTNAFIKANASGNGKDTTITAYRIR